MSAAVDVSRQDAFANSFRTTLAVGRSERLAVCPSWQVLATRSSGHPQLLGFAARRSKQVAISTESFVILSKAFYGPELGGFRCRLERPPPSERPTLCAIRLVVVREK